MATQMTRLNRLAPRQQCTNCEDAAGEVYVSFAERGTGVLLDRALLCYVCGERAAQKLNLAIGKAQR
ncbi:MAG: hypothetical protein Q8S13_04145 [Dehalococcoidia bacterium]|nr:hypothetical protein [Dehalococcoidia bacterium]